MICRLKMETINFKCLQCGSCCKQIVIETDDETNNISVGMCLRPKEVKLFKAYKETEIVPYIGLQRENWTKTKIIMWQMITEPCPLLDKKTNLCLNYENRPVICKCYPFSIEQNGLSIENHCTYCELNVHGVVNIIKEPSQNSALVIQHNMFKRLENMLNSDKKTTGVIFDFKKKIWLTNGVVE